MKYILPAIFSAVLMASVSNASAKTLMMEGKLDGKIEMMQQMGFTVDKPVSKLTFRFALPARFANKAVSQDLNNLEVKAEPTPSQMEEETDRFGNRFRKVTWLDLNQNAQINISFEAHITSQLNAMESKIAMPLGKIPAADAIYLEATELVQSKNPEIVDLARNLTAKAVSEYDAVNAILNYVADSIKYSYNPQQYDALYTLSTKSGNCQNFAHLAMALLRASGIPARIVGGISLKEPWKIPVDNKRSLVQSIGQGGHAWLEIYFPDLGWLSYDPQQSKQFTSTRHIKQTHGLDSRDVNDTWRGVPYLPKYSELIDGKFLDDKVALQLKNSDQEPRPYLISNRLVAKVTPTATPAVPVETKPAPVVIKPKPAPPPKKPPVQGKPSPPPSKPGKTKADQPIEFGNMEFPTLVDTYQVAGNLGTRILDKETSEYVTSRHVYAQAFTVNNTLALEKVSLAMHKFGGDGTIYLDLVKDDHGRPSLSGLRSDLVFLDKLSKKPGYYWVDFQFPAEAGKTVLQKGKYWIVLRHSGEAIMNWFYIPGKPYSGGDDTRSTARGFEWEDILNYDFVFKVRGLSKPLDSAG